MAVAVLTPEQFSQECSRLQTELKALARLALTRDQAELLLQADQRVGYAVEICRPIPRG